MKPLYIFSISVLLFISDASARDFQIWRGTMNITPCSKLITDNGFPYMKYADQLLYAEVIATVDDDYASEAEDALKDCAVRSAAAAGITALVSDGASAFPVFTATMSECSNEKVTPYLEQGENLWDNLTMKTGSECEW